MALEVASPLSAEAVELYTDQLVPEAEELMEKRLLDKLPPGADWRRFAGVFEDSFRPSFAKVLSRLGCPAQAS